MEDLKDMTKRMSTANEFDVANLLDYYNLSCECVDYDRFCGMMKEIEINKNNVNVNNSDLEDDEKIYKYQDMLREIVEKPASSRFHLESEDDSDYNLYKLWVPLKDYTMSGSSHAIIRTNLQRSSETGPHVVALIDFKTDRTVHSDTYHGIFKLIGASFQSHHPVMYIQTDMQDFYFIRIGEELINGRISIIQHKSKTNKGFEILKKWIDLNNTIIYTTSTTCLLAHTIVSCYDRIKEHDKSMKSRLDLPEGVDEKCASLLDPSTIQEAFMRTVQLICDCSRTGEVYKFRIDDRYYAIKIAVETRANERVGLDELIEELKQEAQVYKRLSFLSNQKPWPSLFYAGPLVLYNTKVKFAIVMSFIEGDDLLVGENVRKIWENVDNEQQIYCSNALRRLNSLGIKHFDARVPNFKIQENRAIILDFGFAQVYKNSFLFEELKDCPKDKSDYVSSEFDSSDVSE